MTLTEKIIAKLQEEAEFAGKANMPLVAMGIQQSIKVIKEIDEQEAKDG